MKISFFIAGLLLWSQLAFSELQEIRALQRRLPFIKDSTKKNDALNRLGQLMAARQPDSSYNYLKVARSMAERMNYTRGMATAYKTYGVLLSGNNNYLAASYLSDCIDKFRAIGDKEGESMALMNMANLMYLDDDSTNAHAYLMKSYRMNLTLAKDSVCSIIMNNLNMHSPDYSSQQVNTLYLKGRAIAQKYRDDRMMLYFKLFESYRLWDSGQRDSALQILRSSLKTADSIGNEVLKLTTYFELGNRLRVVDTSKSRWYYQKGLEEATTYHFTSYKLLFAKTLYNYFIRVYSEVEGKEIIVAFADQGSGMTAEQVEKLFRIDETNKHEASQVKGAGIALSICYDMIRQMQGRLWVETKPGAGTIFCYALSIINK